MLSELCGRSGWCDGVVVLWRGGVGDIFGEACVIGVGVAFMWVVWVVLLVWGSNLRMSV